MAALGLVSGFGLGTVLVPLFAFFFPVDVAIAAAGVVHFANNLFKLALVGRFARRDVVVRFGIPAVIGALAGAACMTALAAGASLASYSLGSHTAEVTPLKLLIGVLLAVFASLELWPRYHELTLPMRWLPVGGILSGFFGGVSGMQGALRAPFLLRAGLSRDEFVGTSNVISTLVDVIRLAAYFAGFTWLARTRGHGVLSNNDTLVLVTVACGASFLGSFLATRYLKHFTIRAVRTTVGALLFLAAATLIAGVA